MSLYQYKLKWHKVFAWRPKRISGEFIWFRHYWRKGKLVNSYGGRAMATEVKYEWFHTSEEHFAWMLTGEDDDIVDETFWKKHADLARQAGIVSGIHSVRKPTK